MWHMLRASVWAGEKKVSDLFFEKGTKKGI